ncbi:hypothetical protein Kim5_PA00483 (plasmid) [Rhizobium sp. Kim5]|nr:hypothetical protein Kim5_PA00483 [Rhizobium sp. Kim5]
MKYGRMLGLQAYSQVSDRYGSIRLSSSSIRRLSHSSAAMADPMCCIVPEFEQAQQPRQHAWIMKCRRRNVAPPGLAA